MTPGVNEIEFGRQLLLASKEELFFDLTGKGPLFTKTHPKVLWAQLQFQHNPELDPIHLTIEDWNYDCFPNTLEAKTKYPQIQLSFEAWPWNIFNFLSQNEEHAIISFGEMGTTALSKKILSPEVKHQLHWNVLPIITSYALSPELWGKNGKWPLMHERLLTLFRTHNLLKEGSFPGYYILGQEAHVLGSHGFKGSVFVDTYVLVLPWTFPLSAILKLEKIIQQEF